MKKYIILKIYEIKASVLLFVLKMRLGGKKPFCKKSELIY